MRNFLFILFLSCFLISCDSYPDPSFEPLRSYGFLFDEMPDQRFFAGEWVNDSIAFRVFSIYHPLMDSVQVRFEVTKGGGIITDSSAYTNTQGFAYTSWKLGSESFDQVLTAKVYDLSGVYLSSVNLVAYGFRADQWDACTFSPDAGISQVLADTIHHFTLMISGAKLYRQGERYYLWNEVSNPLMVLPRTIHMDSNGIIYVSTWNGELLRSDDHAESWTLCTKPYPDNPYFIYTYLSNDNTLWVHKFEYPTKYSNDGGVTWTDASTRITENGFGDIFRLKDGSLLYHSGACCGLYRSFDNGQNWSDMNAPENSLELYVDDQDVLFIIAQVNTSLVIYRSTDLGATYSSVCKVRPTFTTSMENTFIKCGEVYYVIIPGYGILESSDLQNFSTYWKDDNIHNLYIDHNGVMIAKFWEPERVYYMKNSN
ncbi:MAG: sialidase family protein [Bacteroidales bacterium]